MNISVVVNGERCDLVPGTRLGAVVDDLKGDRRGVAAAVNAVVVPRAAWDERELEPGDHVEILTAAQGG